MLEKNYFLLFKDKACIIHDPIGHELFTVSMRDKCFSLDLQVVNSVAYNSTLDESALWHRRLRHFNYTALNQMYKNELVLNMPAIEVCSDVCEVCQLGKQSRLPFPVNKA